MLLAFDLDSTIVTRNNEIPPRIAAAIEAAKQEGHIISILTGRPQASTMQFVEQLDISGPYAVNHGAEIFSRHHHPLHKVTMDAATVREIIETYGVPRAQDLDYAFMVGDDIYVAEPQDPRWAWAHTHNRNVYTYSAEEVVDADKVVFAMSRNGKALYQEVKDAYPQLTHYLWADGFLEIIGDGAHKASALARICEHFGVRQEDTIAFGDGVNDVSMIAWAGRGVAVGDAHPEVVAVANDAAPSPDEDGVAGWLERNLLKVKV